MYGKFLLMSKHKTYDSFNQKYLWPQIYVDLHIYDTEFEICCRTYSVIFIILVGI